MRRALEKIGLPRFGAIVASVTYSSVAYELPSHFTHVEQQGLDYAATEGIF